MRRRSAPILLLLALLASAARPIPVGSQDVPVTARAADLTVTTDVVRLQTIGVTISGSGLVEAVEEAAIGAPTSGLALTEMAVREGDRVTAGAVLARLDDALLKAEIDEQRAAIESAEASYATALSAADRGRRLSKTGSVTAETVEERETSVKTAKASLERAKAELATLVVQRERTVVRAPFAGIVSSKPAALGIMVQTGTELLKLQRDGALRAVVDIPEQHLARLAPDAPATVTGPSGETVSGTVTAIGETVEAATHLGRAEIALPKDTGLKAGMFVRARIEAGGTETATIAESALTFRDGRPAVFVVAADGSVRLVEIALGERANGRIAVAGVTGDPERGGAFLDEGMRVVTAGAGFLNDGNRVRVVSEEAANEGSPATRTPTVRMGISK